MREGGSVGGQLVYRYLDCSLAMNITQANEEALERDLIQRQSARMAREKTAQAETTDRKSGAVVLPRKPRNQEDLEEMLGEDLRQRKKDRAKREAEAPALMARLLTEKKPRQPPLHQQVAALAKTVEQLKAQLAQTPGRHAR